MNPKLEGKKGGGGTMGLILVISLTRGNVSSLIPPLITSFLETTSTTVLLKLPNKYSLGVRRRIADHKFVRISLISSGNFPWTGVFAARANKQNWNRVTARLHSWWDNTKREVLKQIFLESAVALVIMCVEELNFCCHVIRFVKSS